MSLSRVGDRCPLYESTMLIRERVRRFVQGHTRRIRVGFAGSGPLMDLVVQGYRTHPRAVLAAAYHPDRSTAKGLASMWGCETACADHSDFLATVDLVEYGELPGGHHSLAVRAIEAGRHVSLPKPLARSVQQADELASVAGRAGVRVRVNDPFLFYPPYLKVKELLGRQEIGEPSSIRIKATVGCGGTWDLPAFSHDLGVEGYLFHPCLDRFSLAIYLLGDIERVATYTNSMDRERGGQALVIFKYKHPGRYGVLDLTLAPQMYIRSNYYPVHEIVEIAGTDGIIWANHCIGRMTEEPPIVVRLARRYYQIGVECELKTDLADAFSGSAHDVLMAILRNRAARSSLAESAEGLRFLLTAAESGRTGSELSVR